MHIQIDTSSGAGAPAIAGCLSSRHRAPSIDNKTVWRFKGNNHPARLSLRLSFGCVGWRWRSEAPLPATAATLRSPSRRRRAAATCPWKIFPPSDPRGRWSKGDPESWLAHGGARSARIEITGRAGPGGGNTRPNPVPLHLLPWMLPLIKAMHRRSMSWWQGFVCLYSTPPKF